MGSLHNDVRLEGGFHENLPKHDGGGWVGSAEHDVTPKINLWYEFSSYCCCQTNHYRMIRICRLHKMNTALLILTEIVEA